MDEIYVLVSCVLCATYSAFFLPLEVIELNITCIHRPERKKQPLNKCVKDRDLNRKTLQKITDIKYYRSMVGWFRKHGAKDSQCVQKRWKGITSANHSSMLLCWYKYFCLSRSYLVTVSRFSSLVSLIILIQKDCTQKLTSKKVGLLLAFSTASQGIQDRNAIKPTGRTLRIQKTHVGRRRYTNKSLIFSLWSKDVDLHHLLHRGAELEGNYNYLRKNERPQ